MHGRYHSREFKLELVKQVENGEKRPAQSCREHKIAESSLLKQRKEYASRGAAAFTPARWLSQLQTKVVTRVSLPSWNASVVSSHQRVQSYPSGYSSSKKSLLESPLFIEERHALVKGLYAAEEKCSIRKLCKLVGVNPAWFYEQPKRAQEKAQEYRQLVETAF